MFCQKCGSQIPDDSTFCRNCGAPVAGKAPVQKTAQPTPQIFTNLLNAIKAFFSPKPEAGLSIVGESKTHEWSILLGANVLFFALSFALNPGQFVLSVFGLILGPIASAAGASVSEYASVMGASGMGQMFNFGFFLLFGLLVSILANAIVFGAYLLLEKIFHRGNQPVIGALNTVAYSTIPVTIVCVLNMLLGLLWGVLIIPFLAAALLMQVFLLYFAVRKNSEKGEVKFLVFILTFLVVAFLVVLVAYLFMQAGVGASIKSALRAAYSSYGW
ncbi:MAG: zinc ribbon domain-containing protein [Clostridia bacterium]|nr:zinc ribbon domain-containing protein [Clostridia bacterium]